VTRKDEKLGVGAAALLRRLVRGETLIVAGALFAAAALSSLPPPSKFLGELAKASARVGPGRVAKTVKAEGYDLKFVVDPNRAALTNDFAIDIARDGRPVTGADVSTHFAMLDMEMQQFGYTFPERSPGHYVRRAPALVMVGHWAFRVDVAPPDAKPFQVIVVDTARG
jgi:copper transport protein